MRCEDFAAFECAWTDKAKGLSRIAETLNLGLDSVVFADDNPAECALVRRERPQVTVVELGNDPADFIARLAAGRWFDTQRFSAEDFARGAAYAARAQSLAELEGATDLGTFLAELEMRGRLFEADRSALARIAQLENKTNQFNLTTRRYNVAAVSDFAARSDALVLGATLQDKFGDHGLVSSLICRFADDSMIIDSWLMSCRVFSRSFEQFIMRGLIESARARGVKTIVGLYQPAAKNTVVANLYFRLGFRLEEAEGRWERACERVLDDLVTFVITDDRR